LKKTIRSSTTRALSLLRPWSATAPPSCWDPTSKSLCTLPAGGGGGGGGGDDDDEGHSWFISFPILVGRNLQCQTQLTDGVQPATSSRRMDRGTTGTDDGTGGFRGGFICHPDVF